MTDSAGCSECGEELPAGARFCPNCGAPRAAAATVVDPPSGESRPATTASGEEATTAPGHEVPAAPGGEPPTGATGARAQESARRDAARGWAGEGRDEPRAAAPRDEPAGPEAPRQPPAGSALPGSGRAAAAELGSVVVAQLRRPSVAGSLLGGAIATGLVALLGLVLGLLFPDEGSIIGFLGADTDIVGETLRQAVSFLQISFDSVSLGAEAQPGATVTGRVTPLLFAVFPVGACALGAAVVLGRDPQAGPTARVIVCAGVTLTFALLMLIAALAAGEADPSAGGAFLLGLLWGGLGSALGAARVTRTGGGLGRRLPEAARPVASAVLTSLRSLGVLLAVTGVLGTAAWVTHVLVAGEEDTARNAVEIALLGADHAVHFAELGAFVEFAPGVGEPQVEQLPAPAADPAAVAGDGEFRIFAYGDGLPAFLFIPGLIVLIALPLVLALYAGFTAAGRAGTGRSPLLGAAWGAVVGPVWAVAMAILDALASKSLSFDLFGGEGVEVPLIGLSTGGSPFASFLLVGTLLGALGGVLAAGSAQGGPHRPPPRGAGGGHVAA